MRLCHLAYVYSMGDVSSVIFLANSRSWLGKRDFALGRAQEPIQAISVRHSKGAEQR